MSENNIDNIYCENTITDQEKIQAIRSDIDNWRKNTPGYGFDNFGNSIEIVEVIERPTYVITL